MNKFTYMLTMLSSLVVSPRANMAFYEALGDFTPGEIKNGFKYLKKDNVKIIYPFYRYGEYDKYMPENLEYYLPGTSIKGALCLGNKIPGGFMVDDVPIPSKEIVVKNLYKAQYLKDIDKAKFDIFFESIGVEMIKTDTKLKSNFYIKDRDTAEALFREANKSTKCKITRMLEYLHQLKKKSYSECFLSVLCEVEESLYPLVNDRDIFLFGGHKGLLLSLENASKELESAIYIDKETMRPHGLVRIEYV